MDSRKFLSVDERAHLEEFLRERLDTDLRNATLILTALHSGARQNELLNLNWSQVNVQTGEVFIETLKGGMPRVVVVPRFVRDALARLKEQSPERPFDISSSRCRELWYEYRPVAKPFHCLRHTFAMRAYGRTKDIRFTQRALGHRSITNTMVYADYCYTAAEFKKLMRVR